MSLRIYLRALPCLLALASPLFGAAVSNAEEGYEQPPFTLNTADILPEAMRSGEGFSIDPRISNDGVMNTYTVRSDFGQMELVGTDTLKARLQEIRATQALARLEESDEFKEAAKRGVTGMVEGGKALIDEPVDTTKNAAKGVGRWLRNVGNSITSDDPHQDNALETITGYDVAKRTYALAMRVDPYTDFQPFQDRLSEVARAATAGGMVTRAAVKVSTAGTVAGTVANVTSLAKMSDLIKDNPPATLESINRDKLIGMGIKDYQADALLKNYNYTPVEITLIAEGLNRMGEIKGREIMTAIAASAPDREVARFMSYHVEMMANYINTVEKADIIGIRGKPWLVSESGALVGAFPLDYLSWTSEAAWSVNLPPEKLQAEGIKSRKLLLQGQFSPRASKELRSRGWEISENVDLKPKP